MSKANHRLQCACQSRVEERLTTLTEDIDDTVQVPLDEDELNFIINALVIHGSNPKFPGRKAPGPLLDKLKRHLFYTRTPGTSDADLPSKDPNYYPRYHSLDQS